jgi:hypothetical protein
VPDRQIRQGLVAAAARGVDVRVIVPGKYIDSPNVRLASRFHYGELLDGGVRIYEYLPTMMHNKVMVVDGIWSSIGSINFVNRSMKKNGEANISVYDRGFAALVEKMIEEDLAQCERFTKEKWRKRGLLAPVLTLSAAVREANACGRKLVGNSETPGRHGEAAPARRGLKAGPGGPAELDLETGREIFGVLRAAAVRDGIAVHAKDLRLLQTPDLLGGQGSGQSRDTPDSRSGDFPGFLDSDCCDSRNHSHGFPPGERMSKTRATRGGPDEARTLVVPPAC